MFRDAIKAIETTISEAIKAGEARAKQSRINSENALKQTIKESAIHAARIAKEEAKIRKEIEESGDIKALEAFYAHERYLKKFLDR